MVQRMEKTGGSHARRAVCDGAAMWLPWLDLLPFRMAFIHCRHESCLLRSITAEKFSGDF